jgi:hypothetical protein
MFQVKWIQTADDELMLLWMLADSITRQAITTASQQIDPALESDPLNVGESRGVDDRVMFVPPLGVLFQVDTAKNIVWVVSVWLCE